MTSVQAPAGLRRRHLVGGGRTSRLADLLADDAAVCASVVVLTLDYAAVSLGSVTGRVSGLVSWSEDGGGKDGGGGVVLGLDRSGRPCVEVRTRAVPGRVDTVTAAEPVRLGDWHRFGLVVGDDEVGLHVDGLLVGSVRLPGASLPAPGDVLVGGRHDTALCDTTSGGTLLAGESVTGVVGAVGLAGHRDRASASAALHDDGPADHAPVDVVAELARWRRTDPYRPTFHFLPPAHWMNEPHAPIQVGRLHHLFFQSNRTGAHWGGIEWGHAVSTDLVHWRHLPPALSPVDTPVAPDGVWSGGSVLDDSGRPMLFFTAGDVRCSPDQSVAVARPRGLGAATSWVADAEPVLRMPTSKALVPGQFRDPFVWREGELWFMLVGAGVVGRGGTALLFESRDGETWHEVGPLLVGDAARHPEVGQMWELPVLLPVSSPSGRTAHVLLVCPWWETVPEGRVVEVVHWLGDWHAGTRSFRPWHPDPRRLDVGRHFTGPSGNVLSDGRTVLWSITQDGRTAAEQAEVGWAHNAGLPLELSLGADDTLRVAPLRELATLREDAILDVDRGSAVPEEPAGRDPAGETVTAPGAVAELPVAPLELDVRCAAVAGTVRVDIVHGHDELHASVGFDCGTGLFQVHRPDARAYDTWSPTERDGAVTPRADGRLRLRVFLDGSMLEAYLGDRAALTTRVRPPAGARLRVVLPPEAADWSVRAWRLGRADLTPPAEPVD